MDEAVVGVAGRSYWRAADARVVVEAWKRSGQRLTEFASEYGIHARRLGRWAQRLECEGELRFHPVRLVAPRGTARPAGEPLEVVLGAGRSVRVPPGFAAEDLARVLAVLEGVC
jgi:hypothetical protein